MLPMTLLVDQSTSYKPALRNCFISFLRLRWSYSVSRMSCQTSRQTSKIWPVLCCRSENSDKEYQPIVGNTVDCNLCHMVTLSQSHCDIVSCSYSSPMKRRQANCLKKYLTPLHRITALQRTVQVMSIGCALGLSWNKKAWHGVHTHSSI